MTINIIKEHRFVTVNVSKGFYNFLGKWTDDESASVQRYKKLQNDYYTFVAKKSCKTLQETISFISKYKNFSTDGDFFPSYEKEL